MKAAFAFSALALSACHCFSQTIVPVDPGADTGGLTTPVHSDARTLQMVIGADLLTGITTGNSITSMSFRMYDDAADAWPEENLTWSNYDIQLSSSVNGPGSLSTNFEENIGSDVMLVRSGPLTIPTASFSFGSAPNEFGFEIVFSTPYLYTPGEDLLVTIRHSGNGVASQIMQATTNTGNYQLLVGEGYDATEGEAAGVMLVTRFSYGVIPEPSVSFLTIGGLLFLGSRRTVRR